MGAVGGAITGPLLAAVKLATDMGSALQDASDRTGLSVEAVSSIGFAAEQSGADMAVLEVAIKAMQQQLAAAAGGSESAAKTFTDLGLSVADLMTMKPEDQLREIAASIAAVEDNTVQVGRAMDVFGAKSGTKLRPMLAQLAALEKQAHDFGVVMSGEDAAAAEAFGDQLSLLWKQLKMSAAQVGLALIPELKKLVALTGPVLRQVIDWVKANKGLIITVGTVAAGLVVVGGALAGLGLALSGIGAALGVVAGIISFIVSPLGLIVVALGAAVYLLARFTSLGEIAGDTWRGVSDAMAAGDLQAAAEIAWSGIKLAWTNGIGFLQAKWIQFKNWFLDIADAMAIGFVDAIFKAWALVGDAQKLAIARNGAVGAILHSANQRRAGSRGELGQIDNDNAAAAIDLMTLAELARLKAEKAAGITSTRGGGGGPGDTLARRVDVAGSFSAAAIAGLGVGGNVAERTAKATEETARATKDTARAVRDLRDQLVFD